MMKSLPNDFVDALLSEQPRNVRKQVNLICTCGNALEMGYCTNCDPVEEVKDCEWCGCCPNPDHCVWSVTCPICKAEPREQCVAQNGFTGLHSERWEAA